LLCENEYFYKYSKFPDILPVFSQEMPFAVRNTGYLAMETPAVGIVTLVWQFYNSKKNAAAAGRFL